MAKRLSRFARFGLMILAVGVAACSHEPEPLPTPFMPTIRAQNTFAVGIDHIVRKYIEPVSIGHLALEGIRGLGALDPDLSAVLDGSDIVISRSDKILVRLALPKDDDVHEWADVVVRSAEASAAHSEEIRAAGVDGVYEAVFDGMLANLDIFSRYSGRADAEKNRAKRSGFDGIGILFRIADNGARIVGVMPESPASTVGLRKNDVILFIDRVSVAGWTSDEIKDRLRGPSKSLVELVVERPEFPNPLIYRVERRHIIASTVIEQVRDRILFLSIRSFNHSTVRDVRHAVERARGDSGMNLEGIVLDLRGDPGGLLKQSISVANLFVTSGKIVSTRGRHPDSIQHYAADDRDIADGLPIIVLIDGKTASAAEIVAAALQDRDRAVVVGTTSYGKGSVQTVIRLPNDGEITLTWSHFVTPAEYVLHRLGVHPTICTSGKKPGGTPQGVDLAQVRLRESALLHAWRTIPVNDVDGRAGLRETCPPEPRTGKLEQEIARALIEDPALYRRVLYPSAGDGMSAENPDIRSSELHASSSGPASAPP